MDTKVRIQISIGPVILLELTLLEAPALPSPNMVVVHHHDSEDDDDKDGPGDLFGGKS